MSSKGFLGGALVGFDRQVGQWVFGAVADFNLANISGSRATQLWQEDLTLEFFGTVRGRGGITYNSTLFYGTGGLAYGRLHSQWKEIDFPSSSDSHSSSVGFAVGGGVEQRLAGYWAWNAEYLYLRLQNYEGKAIFGSATTVHYQSEGDGHIARVGLLYRFE
jgi:outer membrane immunogenic protein